MQNKNKFSGKYIKAKILFWLASYVAGLLAAFIIGFHNIRFDWTLGTFAGGCVFLIGGLAMHGVITLLDKD